MGTTTVIIITIAVITTIMVTGAITTMATIIMVTGGTITITGTTTIIGGTITITRSGKKLAAHIKRQDCMFAALSSFDLGCFWLLFTLNELWAARAAQKPESVRPMLAQAAE